MNPNVKMFLDSLNRFPTTSGVKFVSFEYVSKGTGEFSRYLLNIGVSLENLYRKDVQTLTDLLPTLSGEHLSVCQEILDSLNTSLEVGIGHNPKYVHSPENGDTYETVEGYPSVKIHKGTGDILVKGILVHKKVITEGTYKVVKSRPRTLIKKEIESGLRKSKYREFNIPMGGDRLMTVKVDGETIEIN